MKGPLLPAASLLLLALATPAPAEQPWAQGEQKGWGPIGMLSGLAERVGGAVSETIGIDVEPQPGGPETNGGAPSRAPATPEAEERKP